MSLISEASRLNQKEAFLNSEVRLPNNPTPLLNGKKVEKWTATINFLKEDFFPGLNTVNQWEDPPRYTTDKEMINEEFNEKKEAAAAISPKELEKFEKEGKNTLKGIEYCAIPRQSLETDITLNAQADDVDLWSLRNKTLSVRYEMVKNSPLNGCVVDGRTIKDGITSSLHRAPDTLSLARRMVFIDEEGGEKTLAYAGRPDTEEKFIELMTLVLTGELQEGRKIPYTMENGKKVYSLKVAMHSFLSTAEIGETESDLIKKEGEMLAKCSKEQYDIEIDGQTYCVKPQIAFFAKQFNFMSTLENVLPGSLSGRNNAEEFSKGSLETLESWLTKKQKKDPLIQSCLAHLKSGKLSCEEDLFCRLLICDIAGIAEVLHCRSCVDRTTIAAGMAFAIRAYRKYNLFIDPANPFRMMDQVAFKELFASHVPIGNHMALYSRNQFGFKWQTGPMPLVTLHPAIIRLMPDRFLTDLRFFNSELSISHTIKALYCPLLLLRALNHVMTSWCFAPDYEGAARVFMAILRCLIFLAPAVLGYLAFGILAIAYTVLIFIAGLVYGLILAIKNKNASMLWLILAPIAYFYLPPYKVFKDNPRINDQPILFEKIKDPNKPKLSCCQKMARCFRKMTKCCKT